MNPLKIVFCLPGSSYSGRFLQCWSETLAWCQAKSIRPILSQRSSCNIYYVRNMCLDADVSRGKDQKPFNGELEYDFLMWIDSDIIWRPAHLERLLLADQEIISGLYLMEGGCQYATVLNWDEAFFQAHGCFQFLTPGDIQGRKDLLEVSYTGFGFMLIKRGVFEDLEYPWFRPVYKEIGDAVDFTMEDVGFCLTAKAKGRRILVDPQVIVGHEKMVVV